MSIELLQLMKLVKIGKYKETPPLKLLYEMYHEIETMLHYGRYRTWEILVELLANWIVEHEDYSLGSITCKAFDGLELRYKDVYNHLKELDLFNAYVTAAKNSPWDYLGEIFLEQELVGLGQNLTPRAVIEVMTQMVYAGWNPEAELLCYDSYKQYVLWYYLTYHAPPKHIEPMPYPLKTQLDPCVGGGRFLIVASQMFPKAPLVLFGIEIALSLYRACLVNMAMFSNHPYSIICADTLRIDQKYATTTSSIWDLGNRWVPPDMSSFYWKPPPIWHDRFSLKAYTEQENVKK